MVEDREEVKAVEPPILDQRTIYNQSASKTEIEADLMLLYEFGFNDFLVNEHLLNQYKSTDLVANMLMNGQVDQAAIDAIYQKARA